MCCRDLQEFANLAYLSDFHVSGLLRVAPYCVPGGVRVVSEVGLLLCPSPVARYDALGQDYCHKLAFSHLAAPPSVTSSWLPEQASVAEVLDGEHANELAPKPKRCLAWIAPSRVASSPREIRVPRPQHAAEGQGPAPSLRSVPGFSAIQL
jgi:hypothetical protein